MAKEKLQTPAKASSKKSKAAARPETKKSPQKTPPKPKAAAKVTKKASQSNSPARQGPARDRSNSPSKLGIVPDLSPGKTGHHSNVDRAGRIGLIRPAAQSAVLPRARSRSPTRVTRSSPRKAGAASSPKVPSRDAAGYGYFDERYEATDAYGRWLRGVERAAYNAATCEEDLASFSIPATLGRHKHRPNAESDFEKAVLLGQARGELQTKLLVQAPDIPIVDGRGIVLTSKPGKERGTTTKVQSKRTAETARNQSQASQPSNMRAPSPAKEKSTIKKQQCHNPRGEVVSSTNPKFIPNPKGKPSEKKNPFHETMPAPEVWHRYMPSYFPFGEAPYMEQVMSDQINADLNMSQEQEQPPPKPGVLQSLLKWAGSGPTRDTGPGKKAEAEHFSPWTLPEVTDEEVRQVMQLGQRKRKRDTPASSTAKKARR